MNIFKQFWVSLYSPKEISKFRFQGIGKTLIYVFLLVLLATLPSFIHSTTTVKDGATSFKEALDEKIPSFTIKDGELQTDANVPIEHSKDEFDIFFDGTGTLSAKDVQMKTNNGLALLKNEFVIVAQGSMQAQPYSLLQGFTLTKSDLQGFMKQIDGFLIIMVFIVGISTYVLAAGLKFIEITIMAFVGKILVNAYNPKIQYRHMWRITAYSVTISTVFFTIMSIFQTSVIGGMFVNWAVTLTMIYLVIKEIPLPKSKQKKVQE